MPISRSSGSPLGKPRRPGQSPACSSRRIARAIAWARGTMLASFRNSSGLCALPPTGPTAQMVGAPTAAVKPLSAQPPLNSPSTSRCRRRAAVDVEQRSPPPGSGSAAGTRREWSAGPSYREMKDLPMIAGSCPSPRRGPAAPVAQVDLALRPGRHGVHALPAGDKADIRGDAALEVGQRMEGGDLAASSPMALMPASKLPPEWAALPSMSKRRNAALAPGHHSPSAGRVPS